ncbi:hypothetical protein D3C81_1825300 [compost metagenome]
MLDISEAVNLGSGMRSIVYPFKKPLVKPCAVGRTGVQQKLRGFLRPFLPSIPHHNRFIHGLGASKVLRNPQPVNDIGGDGINFVIRCNKTPLYGV